MTKALNQIAAGLNSRIPSDHSNAGYLHRSMIRKSVEQIEWLIAQSEKKEAQLVADYQHVSSANVTEEVFSSLGARVQQMMNKYGAVAGAPHYDEALVIEIEIAQLEVQADISMLKDLLSDYKQAFKQLTGDTFTPYQRKPSDNRTDAEKLQALKDMRDKLKKAA